MIVTKFSINIKNILVIKIFIIATDIIFFSLLFCGLYLKIESTALYKINANEQCNVRFAVYSAELLKLKLYPHATKCIIDDELHI